MSTIARYQQLIKERPQEFKQSDKGLIRIITNEEVMREFAKEHPDRPIGVVYESPYHLMVVDLVDGGNKKYYTYERVLQQNSGAAVVLPFTPDNKIVLLRQFRHALREEQWGLPRGFGRKGYTAEGNARKEAGEEIGADDAAPTLLGEVVADSGLEGVKVKVFIFEIKDYVTAYGNEGIVEAVAFSVPEIYQMIEKGEINDGFTLSALSLVRGHSPR